jgi:hypothetical protein
LVLRLIFSRLTISQHADTSCLLPGLLRQPPELTGPQVGAFAGEKKELSITDLKNLMIHAIQ